MRKKNVKRAFALMLTMAMMLSTSIPAMAEGWQKNETGWWYGTNADNSSWHANGWQWIDGNKDGVAECYYFDSNGYLLVGTTTPDGYSVNADGAWTENGVVQTKSFGTSSTISDSTVAAGFVQDAGGIKYKKEDGTFVVDTPYLIDDDGDGVYNIFSFNENGYLYRKTSADTFSNKFGIYDEKGRLLQSYYKIYDLRENIMGPYEVVIRNGGWYCINGSLPMDNAGCGFVTGDYAWDAYGVMGRIDYHALGIDVGVHNY